MIDWMQTLNRWLEIPAELHEELICAVSPRAGGWNYCLTGEPFAHTKDGTAIYQAVAIAPNGLTYGRLLSLAQFNHPRWRQELPQ